MLPERRPSLDEIARDHVVRPGVAAAAAVGAARRTSRGWDTAVGCAGTGPSGPIEPSVPFDLASVTKPLVACAAARLARAGRVPLEAPVGRWLPEARGTPTESVPLELLLAHRAGLAAHAPLFAPLVARAPVDVAAGLGLAARGRRADCRGDAPEGGFPPLYSDLGYLLAGAALARATGRELDELVREEVGAPLGLGLGSIRQLGGEARRAPPTEVVSWRGGAVQACVHDENAWALTGHGLAGHAGAFGSVEDVLRFGVGLLEALAGQRPEWLRREELARLVARRPGGTLRAGFDGVSPTGSSAGRRAGSETFGHLGFTGTSLWCDPAAERVVVLLTNRVHPTRTHVAIREARPAVHDALFAWAGE
ncbi:MAG: beta-lactamase family protein [Polyangiaceae bacterium]|nr:beta-lactamase family protein [Polyangiaceae bacterium]